MLNKINLHLKSPLNVLNLIILVLILILPYWIFENKLFVGGDDSRLYYAYPDLWIINVGFFSWFNFTNAGFENPQQFSIPLIAIFWLLSNVLNPLSLNNLAFSLPILLGFIFFQKLIYQLLPEKSDNEVKQTACLLGSFFYIGSPILWAVSYPIFGYSVWWISLFPMLSYYFIKFYRTDNYKYIFLASLISFTFSIAFVGIPYIFGFVLPICCGLILLLLFSWDSFYIPIKKIIIILIGILISQIFWLLPLLISFYSSEKNLVGLSMSAEIGDTFTPTVNATMKDNNLIYPILNLFHRSIVINFNWQPLKNYFINFYDYVIYFNIAFLITIAIGITLSLKQEKYSFQKVNCLALILWITSLFLFTVNVGLLFDLFLLLKYIPGSGMFRNAYDKFSNSYVFFYALIFGLSVYKISNMLRKNKIYFYLFNSVLFLVISINLFPIKDIINSTVWGMDKQFKTVNFPKEYEDFLRQIKNQNIYDSILTLPFYHPAYSVIKDENSDNVYMGASPIKIFTGTNNYSGFYSLSNPNSRNYFYSAVMNKEIDKINLFFKQNLINFFLIQKNLPTQFNESYILKFNLDPRVQEGNDSTLNLFNKNLEFILNKYFIDNEILRSSKGNYVLYKNKFNNTLITGKDISFKKINPVNFEIYIGDSFPEKITFNEPFNKAWKLYYKSITAIDYLNLRDAKVRENLIDKFISWSGLRYLGSDYIPISDNIELNGVNNWKINNIYKKDVQTEFFIFFSNQFYFYLGFLVTIVYLIIFLVYLLFNKHKTNH